jgi:putative ABC transport system ATP-binding protein
MDSLVRTENVWKTYGMNSPRRVDAVKGVSIEIQRGMATAIGGRSGSGKSTLLSLIGLLTKPSSGSIFLDNRDFAGLSEVYRTKVRREKFGFIFQAQYLIPQLSATQNVALPKLCTDMGLKEAEALARERLESLDMGHRLDFRVAELSGGEQQRVSIARSLMNDPEILIADEPSSSIDEALTLELLQTLRGMVEDKGLTVVVASHDPVVLRWADVLYNIHDGEIAGP